MDAEKIFYRILQNEAALNLLVEKSENWEKEELQLVQTLIEFMYKKNLKIIRDELGELKIEPEYIRELRANVLQLKRLGEEMELYLLLDKLITGGILDHYRIQDEISGIMLASAETILEIIDKYLSLYRTLKK